MKTERAYTDPTEVYLDTIKNLQNHIGTVMDRLNRESDIYRMMANLLAATLQFQDNDGNGTTQDEWLDWAMNLATEHVDKNFDRPV